MDEQVLLILNCANCLFIKESAGKTYCGLSLPVKPDLGWDGRPAPPNCPLRKGSVTLKLAPDGE